MGPQRNWRELFEKRHSEGRWVCVGLDPDMSKFPESFLNQYPHTAPWTVALYYCKAIVDATHHYAGAYKPNYAFFVRWGGPGLDALKELIDYIRQANPDIPIILDGKFMDIGNTNQGYVDLVYGYLGVNGVTLHGYLGRDAAEPFLAVKNGLNIFMDKTSNPGAGEIQDMEVAANPELADMLGLKAGQHVPLHRHIAYLISHHWNENGNCGMVVGATYIDDLKIARLITGPDFPILIPGGGKAQGGDPYMAAKVSGEAGIVSLSRDILYASNGPDFAEAGGHRAEELNATIISAHKAAEEEAFWFEIFEAGCIKFGEFKLKSGIMSPVYVDFRGLISHPGLLKKVGERLGESALQIGCVRIAGIPYAGIPLGVAASFASGIPMIYPRKEVKEHGTKRPIEGELHDGEKVLVIDDIITDGASKIEAIEPLVGAGLVVVDVLIVLDREQGGDQVLAQKGYQLHSLGKLTKVLDQLVEAGKVEPAMRQKVAEYLAANQCEVPAT